MVYTLDSDYHFYVVYRIQYHMDKLDMVPLWLAHVLVLPSQLALELLLGTLCKLGICVLHFYVVCHVPHHMDRLDMELSLLAQLLVLP
jgi:hypothetical protein